MASFNINLPPWRSKFRPEDTGEMIQPVELPPVKPYDFGPLAPPELYEEEPVAFSTPARDALMNYANEVPEMQNPNWLNRLTAGMAGASEGWFRGAGAGVAAAQGVLMTPYRQAVERWKLGLQPRQIAAQAEARDSGLGLRYDQLDLARRKQESLDKYRQSMMDWRKSKDPTKSTAYTGSWGSAPVQYIDPQGKVHQISQNTKSGEMFEHIDGQKVPISGLGQGWEKNTSQVRSFTTPDDTLGVYDPNKLLRRSNQGAVTPTDIKVAPPIPAILQGSQGEAVTGMGRGGREVILPRAGEGIYKTPKSEAKLTKEDYIQNMYINANRIGELYPIVEKQLGSLKGHFMALGAKYAPKDLIPTLQKFGMNITPELQEFVQIADDMSAEKVKERSGVAFKDWELRWIQNSVPSYTTSNFASALRRYKQGIRIMMDNRNMTPSQFASQLGKETTKTEQSTPKRWKKYSNGKTFIEDSPNQFREVEPNDVLDEKYRIP